MQNEWFGWDDAKAASNWRDHGVTLEMARLVFKDPFALEWMDDTQGAHEPRYSMTGLAEGRLLLVAHTMRGEATRILSARTADPYERRRYHADNTRA